MLVVSDIPEAFVLDNKIKEQLIFTYYYGGPRLIVVVSDMVREAISILTFPLDLILMPLNLFPLV